MKIFLGIVIAFFVYLAVFGYTIKQSDLAPWYIRFIYAPFMITILSVSIIIVEFFENLKKKFK